MVERFLYAAFSGVVVVGTAWSFMVGKWSVWQVLFMVNYIILWGCLYCKLNRWVLAQKEKE